jgi:hypothetical protein
MSLKTFVWTPPPQGNCYAFAANDPAPKGQGKRPRPGAKMGKPCPEPYNADGVFQACVVDGFLDMSRGKLCDAGQMANPPKPPPNYYLVAVYVLEAKNSKIGTTDFHFVRQEMGTGNWIHKMGPQDACNWDEDFKEMGPDLSKANMGGYTFVGFLAAPHFGVAVELG